MHTILLHSVEQLKKTISLSSSCILTNSYTRSISRHC